MNKRPIFIISGATASGKTGLSIDLAKACIQSNFPTEIINFDSLLFYKDLNIGTAKPSLMERDGIHHHLIDVCELNDEMNASRFSEMASSIIENLHARNITPILVGGSAFYIRALIKGMYEGTTITDEIRSKVASIFTDKGIDHIREVLKDQDPDSFNRLHENDEYRNLRAYEFLLQTGKPISLEKEKIEDPYDFSQTQHPQWESYHIYLDLPKEEHWPIMEMRTKQMIKLGLIDEVKDILKRDGISGSEKSLQSIGYKETIDFLRGETLLTQQELIERIYISTRQLSKSQKTFFKKIKPKHNYHPLQDRDKIVQESLKFLSTFY